MKVQEIPLGQIGPVVVAADAKDHGSWVAAQIMGLELGVAKSAQVIMMTTKVGITPYENRLHGLLRQADDIAKNNRQGKAIVSMSWGITTRMADPAGMAVMRKQLSDRVVYVPQPNRTSCLVKILNILNGDLGTLLVAAAGNDATPNAAYPNKPVSAEINGYPAKFLGEGVLPDLLVVGATDKNGRRASFSQRILSNEKAIVHAPGMLVHCPVPDAPLPGKPVVVKETYQEKSGTSFGKANPGTPPRLPTPG